MSEKLQKSIKYNAQHAFGSFSPAIAHKLLEVGKTRILE